MGPTLVGSNLPICANDLKRKKSGIESGMKAKHNFMLLDILHIYIKEKNLKTK